MGESQDQVEVETPLGKLKAGGKDLATLLTILIMCGVAIVIWVLIEHRQSAAEAATLLQAQLKSNNENITGAIKEMTMAQKESNSTMREWMCLNTLAKEEQKRELLSEAGMCKRIAR